MSDCLRSNRPFPVSIPISVSSFPFPSFPYARALLFHTDTSVLSSPLVVISDGSLTYRELVATTIDCRSLAINRCSKFKLTNYSSSMMITHFTYTFQCEQSCEQLCDLTTLLTFYIIIINSERNELPTRVPVECMPISNGGFWVRISIRSLAALLHTLLRSFLLIAWQTMAVR